MTDWRRLAALSTVLGVALVVFAGWRWTRAAYPAVSSLAGVVYAGSDSCVDCHEDRYESWHRTFHRTMTQPATPQSVVGDFSAKSLSFEGREARFDRKDGRYLIAFGADGGSSVEHEVVRTVGSRRVQQYLAREGDRYVRLPLAWSIEDGRWLHLNALFFDPDGTDFEHHRVVWNANCVFCHNVKAQPGYDWEAKTYDTQVAELGIACEACHGPGGEHLRRTDRAIGRALMSAGLIDAAAVSPSKLPPEREREVCGHCHGQRLPNPEERIRQFLSEGDPYTAGEDLLAYVKPITRESSLPGVDLSLRFWGDGTARLSAYEFQGLLQSDARVKAGLACMDCHSAHGGDPRGMITEEKRGNGGCTSCHRELASPQLAAKHSGHREGSSGTDCYACHMPRIAFGILTAHPTHRIESPDPSRAWKHDMPEACTQCHVDRSVKWAASALIQRGLGEDFGRLPQTFDHEVSETVRGLLAGDPVRRAIAVISLTEPPRGEAPEARLWAIPFLLIAAEDDYPVVRVLAGRGLTRLTGAVSAGEGGAVLRELPAAIEPLATPMERAALIAAWRAAWQRADKSRIPRPDSAVPLDANLQPKDEVVAALRAKRSNVPIQVGE